MKYKPLKPGDKVAAFGYCGHEDDEPTTELEVLARGFRWRGRYYSWKYTTAEVDGFADLHHFCNYGPDRNNGIALAEQLVAECRMGLLDQHVLRVLLCVAAGMFSAALFRETGATPYEASVAGLCVGLLVALVTGDPLEDA